MVEQVGSGIGRMKDEMKAVKLPAPEFKNGWFVYCCVSPKYHRKKFGESSGKDWADIKWINRTNQPLLVGLKLTPSVKTNQRCIVRLRWVFLDVSISDGDASVYSD
jgi:predicted HTH transcriptional regulator